MSFITNLNQQQRKRLHQITLVATFGGLLFGYDTGVINGAFSSLKQYMALTPTTEGLVMSGSAGRRRAGQRVWRQICRLLRPA